MEARQIGRLKDVRRRRDQALVDRLMDRLEREVRDPAANIMPVTIELVKARATLGEIVARLRRVGAPTSSGRCSDAAPAVPHRGPRRRSPTCASASARTRWPDEMPGAGLGVRHRARLPEGARRVLARPRTTGARTRRALNALPQFRRRSAGIDLHFIHEHGRGPDPLPLLLSARLAGLDRGVPQDPARSPIPRASAATRPTRSRSSRRRCPATASRSRPDQPRFGSPTIADVFASLMTDVLGYPRFGAQGGDWGAIITSRARAPRTPSALRRHPPEHADRSAATISRRPSADAGGEAVPRASSAAWQREETGYQWIQGTKPQTLAYGLNDSPAGLAAWIVEKFRTWSDCGGDVERRFTKDELLTNVMLYWVTGAINSSFWPYYDAPARAARRSRRRSASRCRPATPCSRSEIVQPAARVGRAHLQHHAAGR